MAKLQKIMPCLWFDRQGEEAAKFYTSVFPNSRIVSTVVYPDPVADRLEIPRGTVMTVKFLLDGQEFLALNGGPAFQFTEAVSLTVQCESQDEIDHYWSKLTEGGGQEVECGWVKDRYGLSWQIAPAQLAEWMKDPARTERIMLQVMTMKKLDYEALKHA